MFKKISQNANLDEKRELYCLLKLGLSFLTRTTEFLALLLMAFGLAWPLTETVSSRLGGYAGPAVSLALMLAVVALPRLALNYCRSLLAVDFKLDPRPKTRIFKNLLARETRLFLSIWLVSLLLYIALWHLNLWVWSIVAFLVGLTIIILTHWRPDLMAKKQVRPVGQDELSPELLTRLDRWKPINSFKLQDLVVEAGFSPELKGPHLSGMGASTRLIIPEMALAAFPPQVLTFLIVSALMEHMAKGRLYYLFLKISALAVAVPLAALLLNTVGADWGLYLGRVSPALISLVWLAAWLAGLMASLSLHLTRRSLEIQSAAITSIVLNDVGSLPWALEIISDRNLEENSPPAWREFFQPSYSPKNFLKRVDLARYTIELDKK